MENIIGVLLFCFIIALQSYRGPIKHVRKSKDTLKLPRVRQAERSEHAT